MVIERYRIGKPREPQENSSHSIDFSGMWRNRLGSDMGLIVSERKITGIYRTGVGEPTPNEGFDLVGFASGDLITFTVNFGRYDSLTAWARQHIVENGAEKFYTLWHLDKNIKDEDEPKKLLAGILGGANTFERP